MKVMKSSKINYKLWPIFKSVDAATLKNIVLLHIFGSTGNSAIFVTKDDDVYGIGNNFLGFLGIGEIEETEIPLKIDTLCGKYVMGFASSSTHTIAYTLDGEMYSWGDNNLGKLGNGTIISTNTPGKVFLPVGVKVSQAVCNDRYTAAVTSEIKVLHWGDTKWGSGEFQTIPVYIDFPGNINICQISCGALHIVGLSTEGRVYTWGCGDVGQLGIGEIPSQVQLTPRLVEGELSEIRIKQIACSIGATIVLAEDGRVFSFGLNRDGVLGVGVDCEAVIKPQQVQIE